MSSLLYHLFISLLTFPSITISIHSNHILLLFNDTSAHTDSYFQQFISKLLPSPSTNKHIIDCIQIIQQTDTKFITEKHTNCQHISKHITHHTYPFNIPNIHQTLLHTFTIPPLSLFIISPSTNTIQLLHIPDNTLTITSQKTFHNIISAQKHISQTYTSHTRHLLQTTSPTQVTKGPTLRPSPIADPTWEPTLNPTLRPNTIRPSFEPTSNPTSNPTQIPTHNPTSQPTIATENPTSSPTPAPTNDPTPAPTNDPTPTPTNDPTPAPTDQPTNQPTPIPTSQPTNHPTIQPTELTTHPTTAPSIAPTPAPTTSPFMLGEPTESPTSLTNNPSINPTSVPTNIPTVNPTHEPTTNPTLNPTRIPTTNPTFIPTNMPTSYPTNIPTINPTPPSNIPTQSPTNIPTNNPTPHPTDAPILPGTPTMPPTLPTPLPTDVPSITPTKFPTQIPTVTPTRNPTIPPTINPSISPTVTTNNPTRNPTQMPSITPTHNPTISPTRNPTISPTIPTNNPTRNPTQMPTITPTHNPTISPTMYPTISPTTPTNNPTDMPTQSPTNPTVSPSNNPSITPSISPSHTPTQFTSTPTNIPTNIPTNPNIYPSITPTYRPSNWMIPITCPGICDLYNITLTSINQTIINCKKAPNCECKKGIKKLKMKYLGSSVASSIIFYYWNKGNTEICKYTNIKTNDIITCNAANIKYSQFFSETHFIIKSDNNIECSGHIDTSCMDNIIGTLSKQCQYLQIIEYTDYFDDICYDNIPKLLPHSSSDVQQKYYNYWKTKSIHSDSSGGHRHGSTRKLHHWNYKYPSSSHSFSSSSSWSSSNMPWMRWNSIIKQMEHMNCFNGKLGSSEDESYDGYDNKYYAMQTMVCMNYNIKHLIYTNKCGYLDSVLLPLCMNDMTDDMTVNELDNLIVSITPNTLNVKGIDEDGILGVLVQFNENKMVNEFELCMRNVSISMDYYNTYGIIDINKLQIAEYGILNVNEKESACSNSNGLPCLSFDFDVSEYLQSDSHISHSKNCECNNELISVDFKYEGTQKAEIVQIRYNKGRASILCVFNNVSPDDILTCVPGKSENKYINNFGMKTFIDIKTENGYECTGKLWTSCVKHHVLGNMDNGCNVIRIIGWIDSSNKICDNTVNNYRYYLTHYNALLYTNEEIDTETNAINVFDKMDISLKALIIFIGVGICCGLFWVASICCFGVIYQLMHHNREYKQQVQTNNALFDVNPINVKLKQPKETAGKEIETINDTINNKYYEKKEEEQPEEEDDDETDDGSDDGNTYFFNDNTTAKVIKNDMKYEQEEEEEEEDQNLFDVIEFETTQKEYDQESMTRHKFDRESMKSYNTLENITLEEEQLSSSQKTNNNYVVNVISNNMMNTTKYNTFSSTVTNHNSNSNNNSSNNIGNRSGDIDPNVLYTMARLFSQSDSEYPHHD